MMKPNSFTHQKKAWKITRFPIPRNPSNFSFGMGVFDLRFQPWYLMSEQVIWPVHSRDVVRPDPLRGTVSVPEAQLESGKHTQRGGSKSCFFRNHSPNPLCTPTITTMTRIGPKIARPGCETPSVFSPQPPARASADWEHLFLVVVRHLPHQIKQALRCSRECFVAAKEPPFREDSCAQFGNHIHFRQFRSKTIKSL